MTLTEQWKKGELPFGYYYVETADGWQVIDRYYRDCVDYDTYEYGNVWEVLFEDTILEVLAPVPNYDEYLTMKDCAKMVFEAAERETKLKELLKECREKLKYCVRETYELQTKIDEVLK